MTGATPDYPADGIQTTSGKSKSGVAAGVAAEVAADVAADDRAAGWNEWGGEEESAEEPRALTREEAEVLRRKQPGFSPWGVVVVQVLAGTAVALVWWLVSGSSKAAASALYGAAAVVVPHGVMALGLGRLKSANPGAMVMGFMVWEFIKIGLTVAMLLVAGITLHWLYWPALLVAMVVCTKMNWLALLLRGRVAKKTLGTRHRHGK